MDRALVRGIVRGYIRTSAERGQLNRDLPTAREELVCVARALDDPDSVAVLEIAPPWRVFRNRDGEILIDWIDGSAPEPVPTPTVAAEADGTRSDIRGEVQNRGSAWDLLKIAGLILFWGYAIGYSLWFGLAILGLILGSTLGLPDPDRYLPSADAFAIGLPVTLLVGFVILFVGSLIFSRREGRLRGLQGRVDSANGPRRRGA